MYYFSDIIFSRVSYDLLDWTLDNFSEVNVISGDKLFTSCFIEDFPIRSVRLSGPTIKYTVYGSLYK